MRTTLLMAMVLVSGCASPCMRKTTVLEQKQCKWERRAKRDIGLFIVGGIGGIIAFPFIASFVLGGADKPPKFLLPLFTTSWGTAMIGVVDSQYIQGPYPRAEKPCDWVNEAYVCKLAGER